MSWLQAEANRAWRLIRSFAPAYQTCPVLAIRISLNSPPLPPLIPLLSLSVCVYLLTYLFTYLLVSIFSSRLIPSFFFFLISF